MVRFYVKGGVWKNTEDEILKAAVMKYGMNQWARCASLLPRKTPAQCKARWYEWLDPAIKKTEWSREEEERLLHLAKIFHQQWRTIAPIVGRTAAQCLTHYEKLLDAAADGAAGGAGGAGAADDPRRLRPGEIDPHPETKPARPDPVDMDEDEKEMLSEARARLANTRGKKAKRKMREKQLERAKRLAALQKRRELKAAGIETKARRMTAKRAREIDYVKEVPFAKPAPRGFYDTAAEDERAREAVKDGFRVMKLAQAEGKRRDDIEKAKRKKDAEKIRRLAQSDLPQVIANTAKLVDPSTARSRSKLSLPAPSVSDAELLDVVKVTQRAAAEAAEAGMGGSDPTAGLLGQYEQADIASLATPTPMRTPRTAGGMDVVMEEARNLAAMRNETAPLLGGESAVLGAGTGYEGITPSYQGGATPNPLARAAAGGSRAGAGAGSGATPALLGMTPMTAAGSVAGGGATPAGMRDQLSINREQQGQLNSFEASSVAGGVDDGSRRSKRARIEPGTSELRAALSSLPAPQSEVEVVLPEVEDVDDDVQEDLEEDAEERDARRAALEKAAHDAEMQRRSSVLKHEPPLPRPLVVSASQLLADIDEESPVPLVRASGLIQQEMMRVLQHDAFRWPVEEKGAKKPASAPALENYGDEELAAARGMIAAEEAEVRKASEEVMGGPVSVEELGKAWESIAANQVYLPSKKRFVDVDELSNSDAVAATKAKYDRIAGLWAKRRKKAEKLAARVDVLHRGYQKRASALTSEIDATSKGMSKTAIELACFERLAAIEEAALPRRVDAAHRDIGSVAGREAHLQARYAALEAQKRALEQVLAQNAVA